MKYIKKIEDFLDEELFLECQQYAKSKLKSSELSFTTNYYWGEGVRNDSNIVLVHTLRNEELYYRIFDSIEKKLNYSAKWIHFYYWTPGSNIPWHDDANHNSGITIYLNDEWDKNHGGLFLFEDGEEIKGVYPKRNMALEQRGGVEHSVCPTTKNSDIRYTIQIFT